MRPLLAFITAAGTASVLLAGPYGRAEAAHAESFAHVRTADSRLQHLLADGLMRSAALRDLVRRIESSDVIVYIAQAAMGFEAHLRGGLTFMAAGSGERYFRISLDMLQPRDGVIATLGHELQHAVEVSAAREVRSAAAINAFYDGIGVTATHRRWDTAAARAMGERVGAELRRSRAEGLTARSDLAPDSAAGGQQH